ncbi:MAG: antitoxin [Verrucomicrobia bacterium]|nr:antitoxin [Verrucomicrobiota bacterium]
MRTTLDIDDDVLQAARELGRRRRATAGNVISSLARQALTSTYDAAGVVRESEEFYGFKPLPKVPGKIVTNAMIDRLREEGPE